MAWTGKQLAQAAGTGAAATLYQPPAATIAVVKEVRVLDTTGAGGAFIVYWDEDGTTASGATMVFPSYTLAANALYVDKPDWWMSNSAGSIMWNGAANLTITLSGLEFS